MSQQTGLSVADCGSPIRTIDQLGGTGVVWNKALVIPVHLESLNPSIASIEYVHLDTGSSIGEHRQQTDEIYVIQRGQGELRTNGISETIGVGCLAVAPKGTTHAVRNLSADEPLGFLVIEIRTATDYYQPPITLALLSRLEQTEPFQPARIGLRPVLPRVAAIPLTRYMTGPWGRLCLVELPEGGRIDPYTLPCEENLFLFSGHMTLIVGGQQFHSEGLGFNALVPRSVSHAIINRSSRHPLRFLSVELGREREEDNIDATQ